MKTILLVLFGFFTFGCTPKKNKTVIITEKKVYKQSEMAALMLKMYAVNLENKNLILAGKTPVKLPKEFFKIHTATLTDPTNRNTAFNGFSDIYLKTFEDAFNTPDTNFSKKHNTVINSCIACHQTTCIGPIPKIKKLLIP